MTAQDINWKAKCPLNDTPSRNIQVGSKVQGYAQNRFNTELRQGCSGLCPAIQKKSEDRYSYSLFQWLIKLILNITTPHHSWNTNLIVFYSSTRPHWFCIHGFLKAVGDDCSSHYPKHFSSNPACPAFPCRASSPFPITLEDLDLTQMNLSF